MNLVHHELLIGNLYAATAELDDLGERTRIVVLAMKAGWTPERLESRIAEHLEHEEMGGLRMRDVDEFVCERLGCGHPPSWHRLDDGKNVSPVDPAAEFRCIGYDCEQLSVVHVASCSVACPDFLPPPGYADAIAAQA